MKNRFLPVAILGAVLAGWTAPHADAFSFAGPYEGTSVVKTGKKTGQLSSVAEATTTDGSDAQVDVSGAGPKGIRVAVTLVLDGAGRATFTMDARVLADPKITVGRQTVRAGKKIVVKTKAVGVYAAVDAETTTFTVSGNSGRGGGTRITGTLVSTAAGELRLTAQSGFRQKVPGLGRRLDYSFTGTGAPTP